MDELTKIRASLAKLSEVLAGIARTADEKNRERCPYKTVELSCTYVAGCRNQLRAFDAIHCGGDHLNFEPIREPIRHEP